MGLSPTATDRSTKCGELSREARKCRPSWAAQPHCFRFDCHPHLFLRLRWLLEARSLYPHFSCQEEGKRNKKAYSGNLRLLSRNFTSCFCLRSFHRPARRHRVPPNVSAVLILGLHATSHHSGVLSLGRRGRTDFEEQLIDSAAVQILKLGALQNLYLSLGLLFFQNKYFLFIS